ncbi:MAG: sensor histidine kinase [Eubacteriales bacterium]|nr:sensor histidine kinase [Eubacteriales bacterium]
MRRFRHIFSLRQLLVSALILCLLLPMLLAGLFFFLVVSTQLEQNVKANTDFYVEQITRELNGYLDSARNISLMLLATPEISDILVAPPSSETYISIRPVEDMLTRALLYNSAWNSEFLVSAIVFSDSQPDTYVTALRESFYTASIERARSVYLQYQAEQDTNKLVAGNNHTDYIYWVQNYDDIRTMEHIGKIVLEIDPTRLFADQLQALKKIYPGALTYIYNADRTIFFGASDQVSDDALRDTAFPASPDQIGIENDSYYCITRPLQAFSLQAAVLIPSAELYGELLRALGLFGVFCLLMLTCTVLAVVHVYKLIHLPMKGFMNSISIFGSGNLSTRLPQCQVRELNLLSDRFNAMAGQIENLMDEVREKHQLLCESELRLLQSQIDPHFIFNVLQLVNWKATELHADEINQIVSTLANLIRSGIALRGKEKITLREELYYVTGYLQLQSLRYEDRLSFRIEVESERLRSCLVPKLMIQPLVENSIVHGLEPKCGCCEVCIDVWEEIDSLFCRVQDDGAGFRPDGGAPEDGRNAHNHVALDNIRRRLRLLYGDACAFTIRSGPGEGTEVLIQIPIEESEDR